MMTSVLRTLLSSPARRSYSSQAGLNVAALDRWINTEKSLTISDTLRTEHLSNLYITLPTRDGTARPPDMPVEGAPLGYGHHLVFFHPRNPERSLRADGSDADFCPPEPWTRRMWAGGRMEWKRPLRIGEKANAVSTISQIDKKGFEKDSPLVFVRQKIEYKREGSEDICVEEERSHVYLAAPGNKRRVREVKDLPRPDFAFEFTPSPTTLFRFSALTFNGHYIHLDKEYAQKSEGYPERLVHGPLTALMLLESAAFHNQDAAFKLFDYRAVNPIPVNRAIRLCGARQTDTIQVWAEDAETKVVGMTGKIAL
ncbi:hypothetical protein BKA93DRAFT_514862 [Sparassis latifolia]